MDWFNILLQSYFFVSGILNCLWMTEKKKIGWLVKAAGLFLGCVLYAYNDLWILFALNCVLVVLSIRGWFVWRREELATQSA